MYHISERPESFEDFLGNESVVKSLQTQLEDKDRPHVYLFHGPSGCGKTTLARIMAAKLGASGFGIFEKNISNETGVDGARQIISEMDLFPMGDSSCKVYILDEVDKASDSWQSAMKKPLEDVSPSVYFILCTEVPSKIKPSIKTRSSEYKIAALKDDDMLYLIKRVSRKYDLTISSDIYDSILVAANGSARNALTMLEQVQGMDATEALDVIALGVDIPEIIDLCRLLWKSTKWKEVATALKAIREDPEMIRRAVLGYMNAILLNSGDRRASDIIEIFRDSIISSGKAGLTAMCFETIEDTIPF